MFYVFYIYESLSAKMPPERDFLQPIQASAENTLTSLYDAVEAIGFDPIRA